MQEFTTLSVYFLYIFQTFTIPKNYPICKNEELNHRFRVGNMPMEYRHLLEAQEKYLTEVNHLREPTAYTVESLDASPDIRYIFAQKAGQVPCFFLYPGLQSDIPQKLPCGIRFIF